MSPLAVALLLAVSPLAARAYVDKSPEQEAHVVQIKQVTLDCQAELEPTLGVPELGAPLFKCALDKLIAAREAGVEARVRCA